MSGGRGTESARVLLETKAFIAARPETVGGALHDRSAWPLWWPGLSLSLTEDRAERGLRFAAHGRLRVPARACFRIERRKAVEVRGIAEVWLEPVRDGVLMHSYLRVDPVRAIGNRRLRRAAAGWVRASAQLGWRYKDALEGERPVGMPVR